ncbi:transcriptional regulator BetI [Notoacmeibacter sp. MSK16QG-6]|uniref:transcriptional regulator BetI n=1 Tax=Notoacmeibacter sp. MSK16QG-6 TaxID=2957982 RepID=UPI0020A20832|nr:transcriptional regulator BetI [Notoacmeibacter sp. MSK16QG-6]MCP1200792.1 transcriptional regulator BetI [Notoacmeibacter sp. MSK16QG-6]
MPKLGMEKIRREAMIEATIIEIGEVGSLNVPVSQIARRAGISPALAHHYFGSKEQIFLAAMRHILVVFKESVSKRLKRARTSEERVRAIIDASLEPKQFDRDVVSAWLNFYVKSLHSEETSRLLRVYARRLHSNLLFDLRQLFDEETAEKVAQGLASMIDGFYIRHALQDVAPSRTDVHALVNDYLDLWLAREGLQ